MFEFLVTWASLAFVAFIAAFFALLLGTLLVTSALDAWKVWTGQEARAMPRRPMDWPALIAGALSFGVLLSMFRATLGEAPLETGFVAFMGASMVFFLARR